MSDEAWRTKLRELVARGASISEDPSFQENARLNAADDERAVAATRRSWRTARGIPSGFWSVLDNLEPTEALAKVREFVASNKAVLVLAGDVGRGKSVAASFAVDQRGGRYVEAADVVSMAPWDQSGRRDLVTLPMLVIDELGAEPLDRSGYGLAKLQSVLNSRIQWQRKTILVTNLNPETFLDRYADDRLRDRLAAYGMALITRGPSMRGNPVA